MGVENYKKITLGQGDIIFRPTADLKLQVFKLSEPVDVGSAYDGSDEEYCFEINGESIGWWMYFYDELQKVSSREYKGFTIGDDIKMEFVGEDIDKSISVLKRAITIMFAFYSEKLEGELNHEKI